ncbi:unnamed protein product [Didymodactylos carnosus]|uniref:Uncharacterized protein n=1 Tax=Didymodactylos carnosus TaxID=1234261 RepID=A0A813TMZ3_9BILA|nr:unnamed protein product [Didymodactylos carnosus]CAF0810551.1 unnamed protein product [Didymodactylos carnosus]CAF3585997.1 unnamed protein product [Didymodactylos carnosus]CAF3596176.1 unnamed protein product [Didymodactylos carnosus]
MKDHSKNVLDDNDDSNIHHTNGISTNNSQKRSLEDYGFSKNAKRPRHSSIPNNDNNSQVPLNVDIQNNDFQDKQEELKQKTKKRRKKQTGDKTITHLSTNGTKIDGGGNDDDSNQTCDSHTSRKSSARLQPINYVNEISLLPWDRICTNIDQIISAKHQSGVFSHEILLVQQELEALLAMSTLREKLAATVNNSTTNHSVNNRLQLLVRHHQDAERVYGARQFRDIASKFQRPLNIKQQQQFYRQISTTIASIDRFWLEFQSKYSSITQTDLSTIKNIYLFDQLLENEIIQLKQEYLITKNMEQSEQQKQQLSLTSRNLIMEKLKEFLKTVDSHILQSSIASLPIVDEQQQQQLNLSITPGRKLKKENNNTTDVENLAIFNLNQFLSNCDKQKYDVITRYIDHTQLKRFQQCFHSFIPRGSPAYKTPTSSPTMKLNIATINKQSPTLTDNRKRISDSVRCSPRLHFQDSDPNNNPTNLVNILPTFQQKDKQEDEIKGVDIKHESLGLLSKSINPLKRKGTRHKNAQFFSLSSSLIKAEQQQKIQLVADYLTDRTTAHLPVSPILILSPEKENTRQEHNSSSTLTVKRQLFNEPIDNKDTLNNEHLPLVVVPSKIFKKSKRHKKQPYGKIKTIIKKKSVKNERIDSFECKFSLLENLLSECKTLSLLATKRSNIQENIEKVSYIIQQVDEQIENVLIKIGGDDGKRMGKKKTYSMAKNNLIKLLNERKIYEQMLCDEQDKLQQLKKIK